MDFFSVLSFLGGVAMFLFGMQVMGDAIRRQAGGRFKAVLQNLTSNNVKGVLLGTGVTAIIQSSAATCVMVLGFINSGIMTLEGSIGLILGANIGTCATAWILSLNSISGTTFLLQLLNTDSWVPVLAFAGALLQLFARNDKKRDVGLIMLGLAVLMFGMDHMSAALEPLTSSQGFIDMLMLFSNPIMGVVVGFIIAAVTQSSSASVGILQAVSVSCQISFGTVFPIIMGINIGAMLVVLLSSVGGNKDAKRAALIAILYNVIGTVICLGAYSILDRIFDFSLTDRYMGYVGIAIVHTAYKTVIGLAALPFSGFFVRLSRMIIKRDQKENRFLLLDERFLNTPSVAVAWCEELANDMAMFSRDAIGKAMSLVTNYDDQIAHIVRESEEMCDVYEDKLGSYMVKLSQTQMSSTDSRKVSTILHCLSDFERISDHAVNLVKAVEEVEQKNLQLSEVALADLRSIMRPVEEIVNIASDAFLRSDIELAVHVEPLEQVVDTLISQVKVRHVARLQRGECTILRGFVFSDMLTDLSRISDHCSNIAVCVIQMQRNSFDTHEYLNTVKKSDSSFSRQYNDYMEKYAILD